MSQALPFSRGLGGKVKAATIKSSTPDAQDYLAVRDLHCYVWVYNVTSDLASCLSFLACTKPGDAPSPS